MRTQLFDNGFKLWLSANDTYRWARCWPCSELSDKRLFVEYDRGGLVDLTLNGRMGDCPEHELTAIVSDHLRQAARWASVRSVHNKLSNRGQSMISISKRDFRRQLVPDDCPDTSYLEQEGFEDRLEQYRQGDFDYIAVRAAVELPIPYGADRILTRVESPGLWGIESDSGEDYLDSVFQEESGILADMLTELGVKVAD